MNIDDFTLGQLKQIAALFNAPNPVAQKEQNAMIGKYCIARCYAAGVHAGTVVSVDGETVILKNSRRLWSWKANEGVALSGVAQTGIKSDSKLDLINPEILLNGVCELIPCSSIAEASINES